MEYIYIYLYFVLDLCNRYSDKVNKVDIRLPIKPFTTAKSNIKRSS